MKKESKKITGRCIFEAGRVKVVGAVHLIAAAAAWAGLNFVVLEGGSGGVAGGGGRLPVSGRAANPK